MTKLRSLIAATLLTLSVGSLNANAAMTEPGLNGTHSVTGICYIYMGGRWWAVPC